MAAERKAALDEALEWSKKAVELAPAVVLFQDTLGWVYRSRGDLSEAAAVLEQAAAGKPPIADIQYHLGIVYSEQKKNKEAIAAFRKALQINGNFSAAEDARRRITALSRS
jgi:tetratricopeptide (TPR) repeat protein